MTDTTDRIEQEAVLARRIAVAERLIAAHAAALEAGDPALVDLVGVALFVAGRNLAAAMQPDVG
jgi:hypothetical protein